MQLPFRIPIVAAYTLYGGERFAFRFHVWPYMPVWFNMLVGWFVTFRLDCAIFWLRLSQRGTYGERVLFIALVLQAVARVQMMLA